MQDATGNPSLERSAWILQRKVVHVQLGGLGGPAMPHYRIICRQPESLSRVRRGARPQSARLQRKVVHVQLTRASRPLPCSIVERFADRYVRADHPAAAQARSCSGRALRVPLSN